MATFNITRSRKLLQQFDFHTLFIEELGWEQPGQSRPDRIEVEGLGYERRQIAQLAGVVVFELTAEAGQIPEAKARAAVQKQITAHYYENLLIFVDARRSQSVWYWVKRDGSKRYPRSHHYVKGQTGDLFLSKISAMFVDMSELDEQGNIPVVEVAGRMKAAMDIERVTKKFFDEFQLAHTQFLGYIGGIDDERERRWYTSVILNRVMFIWFLQGKGFLNNRDFNYLRQKLQASQSQAADQYYARFLQTLFFEGFAKPEGERDPATQQLIGRIKYLNGGLFLKHPIEEKYPAITIPDAAFEALFALFSRYSWNLDDTVGGRDDEINPDVLGYIFEKYINQKEFGAYYTRPEITEYLCEQTIHKLVLDKLAEVTIDLPGFGNLAGLAAPKFESIGDVYTKLDAPRAKALLFDILPKLSLLDPACGSGAFLVAAMKTLVTIYQGVIGRIDFLKDGDLQQWLDRQRREHPSLDYFIKKRVISHNLYGVDIMAEAVEIARLRLFLALVASAERVEDLEPLPNIDFNILPGNSLIGLLRVDEQAFSQHSPAPAAQPVEGTQLGLLPDQATQLGLFSAGRAATYRETVAEKNRLVAHYKDASTYTDDLQALRDNILAHRRLANATLNQLLLDEFGELKIMFEQATWDATKNKPGRAKKRPLTLTDIADLQPFHWGYEFDEVMNERGGFDAIITNPPWEVFQTDEKEFFQQYAPSIQKKKLRIENWKKQKKQLLADPEIREDWLNYVSRFPYQWSYFKNVKQYKHQISVINGRTVGNKLNLFCLFTEQCFNLLRSKGYCGTVIPSGIYTDLGTKRLREMLLFKTEIKGLFGFENRKGIFEGVDSRFKFVVLTFEKGGQTLEFPAAFMRQDVAELNDFPQNGALSLPTDIIRLMSPQSLSISELKTNTDVGIARKVTSFPLLSDEKNGWGIEIYGEELNMTRSSEYFYTSPTPIPLYEGKMIWQFDHQLASPRYWVKEKEVRPKFLSVRLKRAEKVIRDAGLDIEIDPNKLHLDFESYRLGFRDVAASTNERTMIVTILPRNVACGNTLRIERVFHDQVSNGQLKLNIPQLDPKSRIFLVAVLNSFLLDYLIRHKVTNHLSSFYVYQLPVPRLTEADPAFAPIVERAAKLICTTPDFDDLAAEVGLGSHHNGVTHSVERGQLRAELDGLIAHVYGLTEAEFTHILGTFPLVPEPVKVAAHNAYRDVERGLIK